MDVWFWIVSIPIVLKWEVARPGGAVADAVNPAVWTGLLYVVPCLALYFYFRWKFPNSGGAPARYGLT